MHWYLLLDVKVQSPLWVRNFLVRTCSISVCGRHDVNKVHHTSEWNINWNAPVLGETSQVQVPLPTRTRFLLVHSTKPAPGNQWSNKTHCSNSRKQERKTSHLQGRSHLPEQILSHFPLWTTLQGICCCLEQELSLNPL